MKKRVFALLLAALMLVSLFAGCGKDEGGAKDPQTPGESGTQSGVVYQPTYLPVEVGSEYTLQYIDQMSIRDGKAYLVANCQTGMEVYTDEITGEPVLDENGQPMERPVAETMLFVMDLESRKTSRLEDFVLTPIPEDMLGGTNLTSVTAAADGTLWVVEEMYLHSFNLPETFDPETQDPYEFYVDGGMQITCRHLDATGKSLQDVVLQVEPDLYLSGILIMEDGTIYATDMENLLQFDANGQVSATVPVEGINQLLEVNGQLAVLLWDEEGMAVKTLDAETMTLGEARPVNNRAYYLMPGFGEYPYVYDVNGVLYGSKADGTEVKLVNWMDSDIDSANLTGQVEFDAEGRVYTLEASYGDNGTNYNLIVMNPVDASQVPAKQELTMACMYMNWDTRSQIIDFNKSQNEVRIIMKDYSEYATEEDPNAGIQKLNTEILSGVVPDLFYISSNMPMDAYAAKGILMDLWPLIDGDSELSRDDLMTHFFDVISHDGKLYQVVDRFGISTATGMTKVVGDAPSWTLQELLAAKDALPEGATIFGEMDTKLGVLQNCINRNLGGFIDWDSKQCSFDSQEFIDLLNFANSFPASFDYENYDWNDYQSDEVRMKAGKQMLLQEYIMSFDAVMRTDAMLGGDVNYIGYPTTGANGSSFAVFDGFAISSKCKDVDAAWTFVRQYLTEEHHSQTMNGGGARPMLESAPVPMMQMYYFPTNKAAFEASVKDYMTESFETDPVTGEQVPIAKSYYWPPEGDGVPIYKMNQESYDRFMDLYNSVETVYAENTEISDIIAQECETFFNGQKDAAQTAKLIQDRVGLYIMEQG